MVSTTKNTGLLRLPYRRCFLFLAQPLLTLDLSIAYATWGALGILATTFVDKLFFGLKIKPLGAFGILTMIGGIVMLKML